MNIACSTLPFRSLPLSEALGKIASFGMERVELCVDPLHSDTHRWKERPEEIKSLVEHYKLLINSIHVPLPEEMAGCPYEEVKKRWSLNSMEGIDLAAFLGARFIIQHVRILEMPGNNPLLEKTAPDLLGVARYAAKRKIKVAIENAPSSTERMLGADVGELMNAVHMLPEETVGICLDLSHCVACGIDPVEALESVGTQRLLSVHASDNRASQPSDIHLPLGTGDMPWRQILGILESLRFGGSFVIEVADEEGNRDRALTDSLNFLREIHGSNHWS